MSIVNCIIFPMIGMMLANKHIIGAILLIIVIVIIVALIIIAQLKFILI